MHKTKMYECIVFFPNGYPKKWKYVRDLNSFSQFLSKDHPTWAYINVYGKGSKSFEKRFYPGNLIPKVLGVLLFLGFQAMTFKTFSGREQYTYEKTFGKATFNNGIYYYTTIPNFSKQKGGLLWE